MHNILSRNIAFSSWNRNVIFPNQECSKTIYLFSLHYHFKSIAAEWRRLWRTDLQKPSLSYRNNLLEIFCRPMLPSNLWFSDRLLRILSFCNELRLLLYNLHVYEYLLMLSRGKINLFLKKVMAKKVCISWNRF